MSEVQLAKMRLTRSPSFRTAILRQRRFRTPFSPGVLVCSSVSRPLRDPFQALANHV